MSRVRIDPLEGVYNFRGYSEVGDPNVPLKDEHRVYKIVGSVIIAGESAYVSATLGDMKDAAMRQDFDDELIRRGVKHIHFERHQGGVTSKYKRDIGAHHANN